jgi:glycosyltransferase 2 family protein
MTTARIEASDRAEGTSPPHAKRKKRPLWLRVLTVLFFGAVTVLLVSQARGIAWGEVFQVIADYPVTTLLAAGGAAAASHLIYSTYDLLGRHWTGHAIPARRVMAITFVSYAFNLNLGSLVGGIAFRYRLYSRFGLDNPTITQVLGLSLTTNWLGYLVLAGAVFAAQAVTPPEGWDIGRAALQGLGLALLTAAAAYLLLCAASRRREWTVRGHTITLPPGRLALLQMGVSVLNWMTIGGVLYLLLGMRIDYPLVLGALLMAAVAGVVTHIPAGLGVIEAVFLALLGSQVAQGPLLGALIAYRALYYLLPLVIAGVMFFLLESRAKAERLTGTGLVDEKASSS